MQEPLPFRTQQALEQLEELREEDALDPKVRAMRGLFDLLAYYVIQIAGLWALMVALATLGGPFANQLGLSPKAAAIGLFVILLGTAIAFRMSLDGKAGEKRDKWLRRQARAYMPLIAAALAFFAGWHWRHHNPPDQNRANAERAGWKACAQMPACLSAAKRTNGGDEVERYLVDPKAN